MVSSQLLPVAKLRTGWAYAQCNYFLKSKFNRRGLNELPLDEDVYRGSPIAGHRQILIHVVACRDVNLADAGVVEIAEEIQQGLVCSGVLRLCHSLESFTLLIRPRLLLDFPKFAGKHGRERFRIERAVILLAVHEERWRAFDPGRVPFSGLFLDLRFELVRIQIGFEAIHVQANLFGPAENMFAREIAKMRVHNVVHFPELALSMGSKRRLSRQRGLRLIAQRKLLEHQLHVCRKFLQNSVDLADGLRAERSLIVGELNDREPRIQWTFEGRARHRKRRRRL